MLQLGLDSPSMTWFNGLVINGFDERALMSSSSTWSRYPLHQGAPSYERSNRNRASQLALIDILGTFSYPYATSNALVTRQLLSLCLDRLVSAAWTHTFWRWWGVTSQTISLNGAIRRHPLIASTCLSVKLNYRSVNLSLMRPHLLQDLRFESRERYTSRRRPYIKQRESLWHKFPLFRV